MLYAETSNRLSLKTREHLTTAVLQSSVVLHLLLGHLTYKQDPKRTPTKCQMQVRCSLISYLLVWHNYLQGKENCISFNMEYFCQIINKYTQNVVSSPVRNIYDNLLTISWCAKRFILGPACKPIVISTTVSSDKIILIIIIFPQWIIFTSYFTTTEDATDG